MPNLDNTADDKPAIDPILLKVLDAVPFRLSTEDGIDAARQRLRDLPRRALHPELRVEDRAIPGPAGPIGIRIYWPPADPGCDEAGTPPVVVFFHGGGFVVGDLDTHDGQARQHAVGAHAIVVSVDYRLAPEHPYPAAVEDAWAATLWVAEHAGGLIDGGPARMAVAGDSAGGTIAAVMAQRARDNAGPPIAFQLLWYPSTMWDPSLPAFTENATAPILDVSGRRRVLPLVRGRSRHVRPAAGNGAGAGEKLGQPATGLHRRRRLRPAARRRHPLRRAAGRGRRPRRGGQR